jgi:hypothetical protein
MFSIPYDNLWGYHIHAPPFKQLKDEMREKIYSIEKDIPFEKPDYIPPSACDRCGDKLEICKRPPPLPLDYLACPSCDSTYTISEKKEEPYACELIYKPPHLDGDILDESTPLGKKYKQAQELCKDIKVINLNEKDTRETPKRKPKKDHRKTNSSAVAQVEEAL